jgi:hypothetical protein
MAEQRATRPRRPRTQTAAPAEEPEAARGQVCPVGFCPVGMALTLGEQLRPDVIEHLVAAGRELLLAMKAVVDARVEGFDRTSPLERVTIE